MSQHDHLPKLAAALFCGFVIAACATGRQPPATTLQASITTGLTFQFGMGQQGCGIPQSNDACLDRAKSAFEPGSPAVTVTLDPFAIDVHEVTNEQYRYCVADGACALNAADNTAGIDDYYPNEKYADHPVVQVTWQQAREYCAFVGRRLPTEVEWERVAGGAASSSGDKQVYPWVGAGPQDSLGDCQGRDVNLFACTLQDRPRPVMASADDFVVVDDGGANQKVWDLVGNVYEWTESYGAPDLGCDPSQLYDCDEECLPCLDVKPAEKCKEFCQTCACGTEENGDNRANCYAPCDTPICAHYRAADQPVAASALTSKPRSERTVRGGSFLYGAGQGGFKCHGRSDYRGFHPLASNPHVAIGFRCAKSL